MDLDLCVPMLEMFKKSKDEGCRFEDLAPSGFSHQVNADMWLSHSVLYDNYVLGENFIDMVIDKVIGLYI